MLTAQPGQLSGAELVGDRERLHPASVGVGQAADSLSRSKI